MFTLTFGASRLSIEDVPTGSSLHKHAQYLPASIPPCPEQKNVALVGAGSGSQPKRYERLKRVTAYTEECEKQPKQQDILVELACVKPVESTVFTSVSHRGTCTLSFRDRHLSQV